MFPSECLPNRRTFLKAGAALAAGISGLALAPEPAAAPGRRLLGGRSQARVHTGNWYARLDAPFHAEQVEHNVKGMTQADLDYLLDAKANTIGALLLHLAATDHYYGLNTFRGMKWDSWRDDEKKKWDVPMNLGEPARKAIKGNSLDYYLNILHETREKTLAELKKRDDKWLTIVDKEFGANNYGKWFHVAEHESNHDGQIKFLKSRLPGAKPATE